MYGYPALSVELDFSGPFEGFESAIIGTAVFPLVIDLGSVRIYFLQYSNAITTLRSLEFGLYRARLPSDICGTDHLPCHIRSNGVAPCFFVTA